jgi:enoyl-CoA hydratase
MIGLTRVEDVLTIELQRPERRNALNSQLVEELRESVEKAAGEDVRVVVLAGHGVLRRRRPQR